MRKGARKPRSVKLDAKEGGRSGALFPGDVLKVERRYVVDGVVTCVTDKGRYGGVELVGSLEHIVIEGKDGVRMIPLASVSEIEVVEHGRAPPPRGAGDDPAYR